MFTRLFVRCLPFVVAGAVLASPVLAQTSAPPAATAEASAAPARAHAMVERRISDLRSKLKITPDQTKVFDDFAQVMRDNANRMDGLMKNRTQNVAAMTAVDQMKSYQDMAQAHADDMQRLVPAFTALYTALTPDQKKEADQSFRDFGGGGRRHG